MGGCTIDGIPAGLSANSKGYQVYGHSRAVALLQFATSAKALGTIRAHFAAKNGTINAKRGEMGSEELLHHKHIRTRQGADQRSGRKTGNQMHVHMSESQA